VVKGIESQIVWDRGVQLDIVWAYRTLSDSVGHCLVGPDFVWVGVSGKSNENPTSTNLNQIFFRYDLGHEKN
jgi:hypothetical protein